MGRIEIDDGRRDVVFGAGSDILRHKTGTEASHQPVMDGLAFREHPDSKRGIEISQAFEDMVIKLRNIEQQRMDAPGFRQSDDAFDIDLDHCGIEMDREPVRGKPVHMPAFSKALSAVRE